MNGREQAPGERGKNEGVWEGRAQIPLAPALALTRLLFSLADVFVFYHQLRAWKKLSIG